MHYIDRCPRNDGKILSGDSTSTLLRLILLFESFKSDHYTQSTGKSDGSSQIEPREVSSCMYVSREAFAALGYIAQHIKGIGDHTGTPATMHISVLLHLTMD